MSSNEDREMFESGVKTKIIKSYVIQSFRTIVFNFSVILTTLLPICPRPSSDVSCRTREPTWNFESCPLFNPRGSLSPIPLTMTRYRTHGVLYIDPRPSRQSRDANKRKNSGSRCTLNNGLSQLEIGCQREKSACRLRACGPQ